MTARRRGLGPTRQGEVLGGTKGRQKEAKDGFLLSLKAGGVRR